MRRKVSVSAAIVIMLIGALVTFQITYSFVGAKYQDKLDELTANQMDFSKLAAVDDIVRSQYAGDINEEELVEKTLRGYILGLNDSTCSYLTKDEYSEYILNISGERCGVGINTTWLKNPGGMYIYRISDDSPAAKAGLIVGDVIESVNNEALSDLGYTAAREKLYGTEGATVTLGIRRGEQIVDVKLAYASFREKTVSYSMLEGSVGYIRIYSVNSFTESDFKTAVDDLCAQGAVSMIYDLRNNTGGSLDAVIHMLDYLVSDSVIARTFTDAENVTAVNSTPEHSVDLPAAVIVNSITSSSAELFAASMRDCVSAVIVGEKTYGNAGIQTAVKLSDLSGLIITTSYFAPPESENFNKKGISPDVEVKLDPEHELSLYSLSFSEDAQLQEAVKALTA